MANASVNSRPPTSSAATGAGLNNLPALEEKMKMKKVDHPLAFIFNQLTPPSNLRERFLYATFEIISEHGTDALSASELIKRTKSSKGALFHHFDTLDDLCIQSLVFFRNQMIRFL